MNYFRKNFNQVKNSSLLSPLGKTFLLLVIVFFLFNFNIDSVTLEGQQMQVAGEGHPGYIPKWALNTFLACYEPKPNATVTLNAGQTSIYTGGSTTISWTSDNAETCVGTNFDTSGALDNPTGISVTPNSTTTYTITCTAPGGNQTVSTVTITVKKRPKFIEN